MHCRLVACREKPGRLDYDLRAEFAPRQLGWVALGEHAKSVAVEHDLIALHLDLMRERAVNRIMLEQMGERLCVGDIVDGNDFEILLMKRRAEEHAPDTAEAVDTYFDCHEFRSSLACPGDVSCSNKIIIISLTCYGLWISLSSGDTRKFDSLHGHGNNKRVLRAFMLREVCR